MCGRFNFLVFGSVGEEDLDKVMIDEGVILQKLDNFLLILMRDFAWTDSSCTLVNFYAIEITSP